MHYRTSKCDMSKACIKRNALVDHIMSQNVLLATDPNTVLTIAMWHIQRNKGDLNIISSVVGLLKVVPSN